MVNVTSKIKYQCLKYNVTLEIINVPLEYCLLKCPPPCIPSHTMSPP